MLQFTLWLIWIFVAETGQREGIRDSLRGPRGPKNADDDESWKLSGSIDWQAGGRHSWPLAGTAPTPPLRICMYIHPGCTCADIHTCPHTVHIHTQIPTKTARIDRFPRVARKVTRSTRFNIFTIFIWITKFPTCTMIWHRCESSHLLLSFAQLYNVFLVLSWSGAFGKSL